MPIVFSLLLLYPADMKEYADKKVYIKQSDLQEGDLIPVRNSPTLPELQPRFGKDPYRIVNENNSMITDCEISLWKKGYSQLFVLKQAGSEDDCEQRNKVVE